MWNLHMNHTIASSLNFVAKLPLFLLNAMFFIKNVANPLSEIAPFATLL